MLSGHLWSIMAAMQIRSAKFWVSMVAFEIAFGAAVFAVTRHHYRVQPAAAGPERSQARAPTPAPAWPDPLTGVDPALLEGLPGGPSLDDPIAVSRQADEYFASKQYDRAADRYALLLTLDPGNVDTYNNLGLTLQYLGRSAEALSKLNEGIALNPTYQRIWLTLGFVNVQLGNIGDARIALSNAVMMDPNSDVGKSAATMLESLPQ
jgi:tetratricopeptide (TPR) repeat protein